MSDNLRHWRELAHTPASAVKPIEGGPMKAAGLSNISNAYRVEAMTKRFGPCGIGWGFEVEATEATETDAHVLVRLWYVDGDAKGTIVSWGSSNNRGEQRKSATTDALGKAMSYLGVGADVYAGAFDKAGKAPKRPAQPKPAPKPKPAPTPPPAAKANGASVGQRARDLLTKIRRDMRTPAIAANPEQFRKLLELAKAPVGARGPEFDRFTAADVDRLFRAARCFFDRAYWTNVEQHADRTDAVSNRLDIVAVELGMAAPDPASGQAKVLAAIGLTEDEVPF